MPLYLVNLVDYCSILFIFICDLAALFCFFYIFDIKFRISQKDPWI